MAWTHIRLLAAVLRLWPHRHGGVEPEVLTGAAAAPTGGLDGADWRLQWRQWEQ